MTDEEKIIKYLDSDLTSDEKKVFEEELNNSYELKKKYLNFLTVRENINKIKTLKLNQNYADSILPEFHRKFPSGKKETIRKSLSYAFGVMLVFLISITVLRTFFTDRENSRTLQEFTQSLNTEQKLELLQDLNGDTESYYLIPDNELANLLKTDLEINDEVLEEYDISYKEILSELDESKLDYVYQKILNKNILEEVTL